MAITVTFAEPLTTMLEQEAERLHVSIEDLATTLLNEALLAREIERATTGDDQATTSLEQIVAQIKALPPTLEAFQPAERAQDIAYIDYLLANPPQDTVTLEEWERFWPAVEQELELMDRADELTEGHRETDGCLPG
jgi:signal transduction protein with GAF and PtsI domain